MSDLSTSKMMVAANQETLAAISWASSWVQVANLLDMFSFQVFILLSCCTFCLLKGISLFHLALRFANACPRCVYLSFQANILRVVSGSSAYIIKVLPILKLIKTRICFKSVLMLFDLKQVLAKYGFSWTNVGKSQRTTISYSKYFW